MPRKQEGALLGNMGKNLLLFILSRSYHNPNRQSTVEMIINLTSYVGVTWYIGGHCVA